MIAVPAVDLREGRCVQLVGGRPERERLSLPDPVAVARGWTELGFRSLHLVDLDAALGLGENRTLVREILREVRAETQVGGGVRDAAAVASLLAAGARRVVVGTRAVEDPLWIEELAARHPGALMVAADVRNGEVLRRGWTEGSGLPLPEFLAALRDLPLAGVLCTDVGREGRLAGVDPVTVEAALEAAGHPVWIAGGIRTLEELRTLASMGAAGAVLGTALYTGDLDPAAAAEEFGG